MRCNGVAPGVTKTFARTKIESMTMKLSEEENEQFLINAAADVPLEHKLNEAVEVANAIMFLASEDAEFITGEILTIDGGQSLTSDRYDDFSKWLKEEYID